MFPVNRLHVKRTEESYLADIKNNGLLLDEVPYKEITAKLCLAAVKQNGLALEFVPPEMMTEELCFAAIQNDGWALQHVPSEMSPMNSSLTKFVSLLFKKMDWHCSMFLLR